MEEAIADYDSGVGGNNLTEIAIILIFGYAVFRYFILPILGIT